MNILGPLPPARGGAKFVIVAIDYFTKLIEAKPLVKITGKEVIRFVMDNIICRFGLPRIIVTDNRAQLVNDPFKSWCGSEAVILAEIGIPTYRTLMIREEYNEQEMRLNLDLLQERRETAAVREAKYKTKMEQCYNKKVRPAGFRPGEFMFRRNEPSRVEDQGILGPKWEGPYRVMEAYKNGSYKLQTLEDKEVPRTWHAINLRKCYV
ncbi:reverse transcriptase domain-containing protein [Tanacetum coccineum]